MSQYVTLLGAEGVERAGYSMRDAAATMSRAADRIEEAMRSVVALTESVERLTAAVEHFNRSQQTRGEG